MLISLLFLVGHMPVHLIFIAWDRIGVHTMQVSVVSPWGAYHPLNICLSCLNTCMLVGSISSLHSIPQRHDLVSALSLAARKEPQFFRLKATLNSEKIAKDFKRR